MPSPWPPESRDAGEVGLGSSRRSPWGGRSRSAFPQDELELAAGVRKALGRAGGAGPRRLSLRRTGKSRPSRASGDLVGTWRWRRWQTAGFLAGGEQALSAGGISAHRWGSPGGETLGRACPPKPRAGRWGVG